MQCDCINITLFDSCSNLRNLFVSYIIQYLQIRLSSFWCNIEGYKHTAYKLTTTLLPNPGHPELVQKREIQRTSIPQPRSCHQRWPPAARSQILIKQNIAAKWPRPLLNSSTSLGPSETDTCANQKFASFFLRRHVSTTPASTPSHRYSVQQCSEIEWKQAEYRQLYVSIASITIVQANAECQDFWPVVYGMTCLLVKREGKSFNVFP